MKKILTLIYLLSSLTGFAQFKINGKISGISKADTITLNLPFIYGYYKENNWEIPVDKAGNFSFNLPLKAQKFATLEYNGHTVTVLLTPGKSLTVGLDSAGVYSTFGGTAAVENKLLYQAKLSEISFFGKGERGKNPYDKLSNAEVKERIIKPWFATRDENIKWVIDSKLSAKDKALIVSEIKYNAYVQLDFFARGIMNTDKKQISELVQYIYDGAKPEPDVFPAGPEYYWYAASYLSYLDNKAFSGKSLDDPAGKQAFFDEYKMGLDSATKVSKLNGKSYIRWHLLNLYFSKQVGEQYLAQAIFTQSHEKDISKVAPLMKDFKANFPNSKYTGFLQGKLDMLNAIYDKNADNANIKVFANYGKVKSIYDVINTLKGKVVYVDIWGTWCPACRDDLNFVTQLKERFKGKDVVFVYLDMDDEIKDADWKKFIRINNMAGIHLRKNKAEIQKFWDEMQPDKKKQSFYPTCFIFDKNGKLVVSDALRPPDEAALYAQIEKYL